MMNKADKALYEKLISQPKTPDPDPLMVGFYDPASHTMVSVEIWTTNLFFARYSAIGMAKTYQSGAHCMPSSIWCVWNKTEVASIYPLDGKTYDEAFLNGILKLLV